MTCIPTATLNRKGGEIMEEKKKRGRKLGTRFENGYSKKKKLKEVKEEVKE